MSILKGKLTYLLSGIAVLFGLASLATGQFVEQDKAIEIVWTGLAVFGIRRAIS